MAFRILWRRCGKFERGVEFQKHPNKVLCLGALCPITIKKALQEVEGVQQVIVDFDTKTAAITFDSKKTDSDALIKATTNAGYPSAIDAPNVQ